MMQATQHQQQQQPLLLLHQHAVQLGPLHPSRQELRMVQPVLVLLMLLAVAAVKVIAAAAAAQVKKKKRKALHLDPAAVNLKMKTVLAVVRLL
jgi:uncharacterized membrane protein